MMHWVFLLQSLCVNRPLCIALPALSLFHSMSLSCLPSLTPTNHTTSRQILELMLQSGMFRHHGFNTSVDRSRVMVSMETQHMRANFHYLYHYGDQRSKNGGSSK
uniref:Secreted protein n=1 Tax=Astatotilapia calliptera TaxID=8154 RepID=A0AAX7TJW5_ASTCA